MRYFYKYKPNRIRTYLQQHSVNKHKSHLQLISSRKKKIDSEGQTGRVVVGDLEIVAKSRALGGGGRARKNM